MKPNSICVVFSGCRTLPVVGKILLGMLVGMVVAMLDVPDPDVVEEVPAKVMLATTV